MVNIKTLEDINNLSENVELECKLAAGRDGKGQLPKDFWPTYSSFANTRGGVILLGVKEKKGTFSLQGVAEPQRLVTSLFNHLNNPQKVSVNLLTDRDVQILSIEERQFVLIRIPAASRQNKPVFLNGNPLQGNTFRRLHEGDRPCDDATVKRMLAEQVEDSRDRKILPGFDLHDIDIESLHRYRQMLSSLRPDHPWNTLPDQEVLRVQGGFRQDRQSEEKGLTLAGLLMFGQWPSIQEALPGYFVDYQEQGEDKGSHTRWLDRVIPDGTWSGNIFDFFLKTSRKLTADLKVPFQLKGHFRQDDTPLHRALREALVNTLVHADYSDRASILIKKNPEGFLFRNPGLMRVPTEQALQGGESDCRNQTLHQLFLMINLGERAGSGLPKIRQGWENNGGILHLSDAFEPYDQTRLEMLWEAIEERNAGETPGKRRGNAGETPGKTTEQILQLLATTPAMTIPELAALLNRSESAVERAIRKLRQEEKLKRIGPAKGGYWQIL